MNQDNKLYDNNDDGIRIRGSQESKKREQKNSKKRVSKVKHIRNREIISKPVKQSKNTISSPQKSKTPIAFIIFVIIIASLGWYLYSFHGSEIHKSINNNRISPKTDTTINDIEDKNKVIAQKKELPYPAKIKELSTSIPPDKKKNESADLAPSSNDKAVFTVTKKIKKRKIISKTETKNGKHYIRFEAEDANIIKPSFEIADDTECSGGKYLSHPEGTGSAWRKWKDSDGNEIVGGVGRAEYDFEVPEDGKYLLWGRVLWESGCSAAFMVDIDDLVSKNKSGYRQTGSQKTFGKSSTLDTWHWYSRHVFNLTKGKHTLVLSNQDDGSHVDHFLITNDFNYVPIEREKEKIHFGGNYYCHFGSHQFEELEGAWSVKKDKLYSNSKTAKAIVGKEWWKNYQITCMLKPANKGIAGFIAYYDDNNYYSLEISKNKIELCLNSNGKRRVLTSKRKKLDLEKQYRISMNIVNGVIQVFIDGKMVIHKKNDTISSGKAGIMISKAENSYFDDIEITSISTYHKSKNNETIPWFNMHECIQSRTVLDDGYFGRGYQYPFYDKYLAKCQYLITNKKVTDKFAHVGFHWRTINDNAFRAYSGNAQGPGFIIAQSFDKERKFIWSNRNLYGDWELKFKAKGECDILGGALVEMEDNADKAKRFLFAYNIKQGRLETETQLDSIATGVWKERGWNNILIKKRKNILTFHLNNKKLGEYKVKNNIVLRPAIFYQNGTLFIDNITTTLHPDLFYHFEYNQPYSLALSDWTAKYDTLDHWGGYHSFLTLTRNNGKVPTMRSKREWKGDFALSFIIDSGRKNHKERNMRKFSITFENSKKPKDYVRLVLTPSGLSLSSEGKKSKLKKLNFHHYNNEVMGDMLEFDIVKKDGNIFVFLSDKKGIQRLVMKEKFNFSKKAPFKISIAGFPSISIQQIRIWGKEHLQKK